MVKALLSGRKSQTRRVLKPQPGGLEARPLGFVGVPARFAFTEVHPGGSNWTHYAKVPYAPGDRLYVREAFSYETLDVDRNGFMPPWYWADGSPDTGDFTRPKPSIHMPRWASRITLTVTDVRVQRLQEISALDSIAEGVECPTCVAMATSACNRRGCFASIAEYRDLWNSLHGPDAWAANPWVVALTFTVHHGNIDANPTPIQEPQP